MATYKRQRYLLMTTDPVHIGTGGYRLGRVDNSIVREPGTRVPKIPGTSLHGAARSYAAQLYERPVCAGQGQPKDGREGHCGSSDCPVCYAFGYLKQENGQEDKMVAFSGVVNVFDAHVLLFPVHSMAGPVWVSTVRRLQEAGFSVENVPDEWDTGTVLLTWKRDEALNLGWLMVKAGGQATVAAPDKWQDEPRWKAVQTSLVLVQDALFSQVVNSNLEVRTSVAIDPERGAAEEGALFTYEALPRATFLTVEVVLDDYRREGEHWPLGEVRETRPKNGKPKPLPGGPWTDPLDVVAAGLGMIEWLGVGGMGTRGFGRMAIAGEPLEQVYGEEVWQ
ncbi:MAG: type III-B CRISPR module RAMP protein Cmr4 [Ardenticatenaceae bacterium]|nr:type III-B CRISPR module RAMP protein Cmr4 [Ardenticatenaceae bacterium]